ncbi:hypothetical protein COV19_03500, partial [Candidatus Woesearchaeota archaeon CG10_big_fil_rev_8_21_14_0_10_44_13]
MKTDEKMNEKAVKPEDRKRELARRMRLCEDYKKNIILLAKNLRYRHEKGEIDDIEYNHQLYSQLKGKDPEQWMRYYDNHIELCRREMEKTDRVTDDKGVMLKNIAVVVVLLLVMLAGTFFGEYVNTGMTVLDDASVFAGRENYTLGDMAHLFIAPPGVDYTIEVYDPENKLYAVSLDFPLEKTGTYTIKAVLRYEDASKEIDSKFNVMDDVIEESPEQGAGIDETDNLTGNLTDLTMEGVTAGAVDNSTSDDVYNETEEITTFNLTITEIPMDEAGVPAEGIEAEGIGINETQDKFSLKKSIFASDKQIIKFSKEEIITDYEKDEENRIIPVSTMEKEGLRIKVRGADKDGF